jgi:hypothetical protein
MPTNKLTLKEVYAELKLAVAYAHEMLIKHGRESTKFKVADSRMNDLVEQKSRMLLGLE